MAEENINNAEEIEKEIEEEIEEEIEIKGTEPLKAEKEAESGAEAEAETESGAEAEVKAETDAEAEAEAEESGQAAEENTPAGENEEASAADNENEKNGEAGKSSMFGRKNKEIEKCREQIDELTDKLKRNMAEFENFRKRTDKEKANNYIIGARDVVEKILPVVDSFERGLDAAPEGDPFADGMKLVYKQLVTALEDLGVKPIEAVGKEFDPNLHNAVMHVEDEEAGENTIVEEFQKGYTYKDTVVRHSMVKVAN